MAAVAATEPFAAGGDCDWGDFCERHATAAAQDFSRSCVQFIAMNLPEGERAGVNHRDMLKRFVERFSEQFEADFCRRRLQAVKMSNGTERHGDTFNDCASNVDEESPKMHHKPFFRR